MLSRFEYDGFDILQHKVVVPDDNILDQHYQDYVDEPWYLSLNAYTQEDRIVAGTSERENAVERARDHISYIEFVSTKPWTIRAIVGGDSYGEADAECGNL